jgi:hypothetical protein
MRNRVVDEPIEKELEEVKETEDNLEPSTEQSFEIPDKFVDKNQEEIVKSYMELEKELGRKGNEIGELRKLTDDYLKRELHRPEPVNAAPEPESDFDFDNANKSVDQRIESNPRIKQLEDRLAENEALGRLQHFEDKHPDYRKVGSDVEFQEWVADSRYRTNMYAKADQAGDYDAADELLGAWKEHKSLEEVTKVKETKTRTRAKALTDIATTSAGTGVTSDRVYRRADLIKLRIDDPHRYEQLSEEIRLAYAEGRVR